MTELTVPEGFVEFSMQVMSRAVKLREEGKADECESVAYSAGGKANWVSATQLPELVEVAARALLLAVGPMTIEGEANGPRE